MRGPLAALLFSVALAGCGGSRSYDVPTRAAFAPPRFADVDPHDWDGIRPWDYPVHGIDVSRYQGAIDWDRARASGASFAFIKATEGGDVVDDHFQDNWTGAGRAGVARGAYHYFYFCRPAIEQAEWFIAHVPRGSALPPVLDMEWNHRSRTCPFRPDPVSVRREMQVYLSRISGYFGKRPIIYTTLDFYQQNELWRMHGADFWLRSVAGHPSETYPSQRWVFWQYTGTGVVAGVPETTDLNVFSGSQTQWAAFVASSAR